MTLVEIGEEEHNSGEEATYRCFSIESNYMLVENTFNSAKEESTYEKTTIGMDGA